MKTLQIILSLVIWLLLMPPFHDALEHKVYATESVGFMLRAARHNTKPGSTYGTTPQEEKKVFKQPSGPNPAGNHLPPSKS
uniref:uncharacterized protein LOC122580856 isoform X2 n=1 Tax=Erigeron canadensis TaxID=72917 RepID=UPI001CB96016|nr:uncharacterized protein LOC122580856 isoform X2 [Erigeron canadensis]